MLEIITGISSGYFVASMINSKLKEKLILDGTYKDTQIIENKDEIDGIKITTINKKVSMPFYINSGHNVGVSIPIGGGEVTDEEKELHSIFLKKNKNDYYENFECIDNHSKKYYINTPDHLNSTLELYRIDKQKFPIQLPVAVYNYNLNNPNYIIYNNNVGVIGSNKRLVVKKYVFKTRYPYTYTMGICGGIGLFLMYDTYLKKI